MMVNTDRYRLEGAATLAAKGAYCPYSNFHVGAAVEDEDGRIHTGVNIENASYGLTLCAERVALARAIAYGATQIRAIAIACPDAPEDSGLLSRVPCGACRQWLAELAPDALIYIVGVDREFTVDDLLPMAFRLKGE